MKIIKEGSIYIGPNGYILVGWSVEGGTSDDLLEYAINKNLGFLARFIFRQ